jgi:hypothetical protein
MKSSSSKILGIAFLFQFITSFSSGVFLKPTWFVPDDISATLLRIAAHPAWLRTSIFLDMLTALGVIFLGVVLFVSLKKHNEKLALTALGFYILEAALLAASRSNCFTLLSFSQAYSNGQPADLLVLGQAAYDAMEFVGGTLHMLVFCVGALLFYTLLVQTRLVPRWLSLWGLITTVPMLVGTVAQIFGYSIPFILYVPYVPFELFIGGWILVRGIPDPQPST